MPSESPTTDSPPLGGDAIADVGRAEAGPSAAEARRTQNSRQIVLVTLIAVLILWTYSYNVFIKAQTPVEAFFKIVDTISDDFVIGSLVTIATGVLISILFSATKLYSQVMANVHSFRILEQMVVRDLAQGKWKDFAVGLLHFRDQPTVPGWCPTRVWAALMSLAFIYVLSWIYLLLFSEALFFVAWSAGVNPEVNENTMIQMPMLALAIPFSARVMAYLRYPYAQDYADFMPGAVFVLLVVAAIGYLFESDDQQFYLVRVFTNKKLAAMFLRNAPFLAFIPVFFEASCWIFELTRPRRDEPSTTA